MAPPPPVPGGRRPPGRGDRRARDASLRASWPPALQFVIAFLSDPVVFRRGIIAFWNIVAAVLVLGAVVYLVSAHSPWWVKGGISAGSSVIITLGGAAFSRHRAKRRERQARQREDGKLACLGISLPG